MNHAAVTFILIQFLHFSSTNAYVTPASSVGSLCQKDRLSSSPSAFVVESRLFSSVQRGSVASDAVTVGDASTKDNVFGGLIQAEYVQKKGMVDRNSKLDAPAEDQRVYGVVEDIILPVFSGSLLITANTVGAGTMILPEVAAGPGFVPTSEAFLAVYVLNLISSLLISEVAIKQHESCSSEASAVPSSFKEFADMNLGPVAGNAMSFISLFINICVLAFALMRSHEVFGIFSGDLDPVAVAGAFASVLCVLSAGLKNSVLSSVSSVAAAIMFATFAGVVLPSLPFAFTHAEQAMVPGTAAETGETLQAAIGILPIILMVSTYQNITPTVTKLLNFDRLKVVAATIIGSGIPLLMYCCWMFVNMTGGVDSVNSLSSSSFSLSTFMMTSLVGSSIACTISIAEEFESLLQTEENPIQECLLDENGNAIPVDSKLDDKCLSLPSVMLSVSLPLVAGAVFAQDGAFTAALDMAGEYGATILYGIVPVALAWTQRRRDEEGESSASDLLPGGHVPMYALGSSAIVYLGQSFITDMCDIFGKIVSS